MHFIFRRFSVCLNTIFHGVDFDFKNKSYVYVCLKIPFSFHIHPEILLYFYKSEWPPGGGQQPWNVMNSIYTPQNLQENNANFRVSLIKWSNFRAARGGSAALKLPGNLQLFPGGSDRKMSIQKKMKINCARRRFRTKIKSLETTSSHGCKGSEATNYEKGREDLWWPMGSGDTERFEFPWVFPHLLLFLYFSLSFIFGAQKFKILRKLFMNFTFLAFIVFSFFIQIIFGMNTLVFGTFKNWEKTFRKFFKCIEHLWIGSAGRLWDWTWYHLGMMSLKRKAEFFCLTGQPRGALSKTILQQFWCASSRDDTDPNGLDQIQTPLVSYYFLFMFFLLPGVSLFLIFGTGNLRFWGAFRSSPQFPFIFLIVYIFRGPPRNWKFPNKIPFISFFSFTFPFFVAWFSGPENWRFWIIFSLSCIVL